MPRFGRRVAFFGLFTAMLLGPALAEPPKFAVDPTWPQTLPNNWIIGTIGGISVDAQDHIWINQRPSSLDTREKRATTDPNVKCCVPAPPVIEFDQDGKVVQGWGGDGPGYKWGNDGHGIHVDHNNFVWVGDNIETRRPHLQIHPRRQVRDAASASPARPSGSNDIEHFGRPADMVVDRETNEMFVADGYGNQRVIVFDAATGAYKRHWGAYGKPPTDEKPRGIPRARRRSSSPIRCTASPSPTTGWCWCATAATTACRCSARTAPSCAKSSVLKESAPGTIGSIAKWPDAAQTYLLVVDDPNGQFHVINRAERQARGLVRPRRPPARRVLQPPLHRHRQQGQRLYRRSAGQAGAEIPQSRRALGSATGVALDRDR